MSSSELRQGDDCHVVFGPGTAGKKSYRFWTGRRERIVLSSLGQMRKQY